MTGKMVIPPWFDWVDDFSEGRALVKVDGQSGFIGTDGQFVIQLRSATATRFSEGLAVVLQNGKFAYIDRAGNSIVEPQFDSADSFSEGLALVVHNGKPVYIRISLKY